MAKAASTWWRSYKSISAHFNVTVNNNNNNALLKNKQFRKNPNPNEDNILKQQA